MIRDVILAAGSDINRFADMATAFSVKKKLSYRIGWLIKGPAKFLANLKIGTVGNWTRAETGLSKADYASIKEEKALDFIISLVLGLYGGDAPYTPDTPYYKITCGMLNIIDSILRALHINLGKLVKGANSVRSLVEPLLYTPASATKKQCCPSIRLLMQAIRRRSRCGRRQKKARPLPLPEQYPDTIRPSRKGVPAVLLAALCLVLLLPFLIVLLPAGFLVNQLRFAKKAKE